MEEQIQSLEHRLSEALAEVNRKDQMLIKQSRQADMGEMINNIAHQWRQPLNNLAVRATEYTQGSDGEESMPSELPDTLDTWHQLIHPDDSGAAPVSAS